VRQFYKARFNIDLHYCTDDCGDGESRRVGCSIDDDDSENAKSDVLLLCRL